MYTKCLKMFFKEVLCKCKHGLRNHLTAIYFTRKVFLFLFSFRQCYPTISEWVALSLDVEGHSKGLFTIIKATYGDALSTFI